MRLPILVCLIATEALGQQISVGSITQKANCAVTGVIGAVTLNCPGLNPRGNGVLNQQFKARLKERDLRIEQVTKEAGEWRDRYLDLTARLAEAGVNNSLKQRADDLLKDGKLNEASRVLDRVLATGEKDVDEIARSHFERARLYELEFKPLQALPHYEKAYDYRASNDDYGEAFADLLYRERDFSVERIWYISKRYRSAVSPPERTLRRIFRALLQL